MRHLKFILNILFVVFVFSSIANAQMRTGVRYNEGPGVKLTDGVVFHPGVAIEGRYDSNVLFTDTGLKGAPYLRLIGHLSIASTSPQRRTDGDGGVASSKVKFALNSSLAYREYFSDETFVTNQRGLDITAGGNLTWDASRHFSMVITDNFTRTVLARNNLVVAGGDGHVVTQYLNRLGTTLNIVPGGGRLSFALGYAMGLTYFEEEAFDNSNRLGHELSFQGKYKLLPKTAFIVDVVQQFTGYLASDTANVSSMPFSVYGGFIGLFTPRLTALLKAGYGNSFHGSGASFGSFIMKGELGYSVGPTIKLKLGYDKTFADSIFANYFSDHSVYGSYDHLIGSRFIFHGDIRFINRTFGGFEKVTVSALKQNILTGGLSFDYQIQDWVYVGVGYDLQLQSADTALTGGGGSVIGATDYVRHQLYGKLGISY